MNSAEALALAEKIMHSDKVIHIQQLNIPWKPPSDPIFVFMRGDQSASGGTSGEGGSFKGAESATQNNSLMNQNTSLMESHNQN